MSPEDCEGCHERPDPGGAGWCRMFRLRPKGVCQRNKSKKKEMTVGEFNVIINAICCKMLEELGEGLSDDGES